MTLQDAADIAQIVGAIAVVVSLAYVAQEIRHNSRELRLAAQQAQADSLSSFMLESALSEEFGGLLKRQVAGPALDRVDGLRIGLLLSAAFTQFQMAFETRELGETSRRWWITQERAMRRWLAVPFTRDWWRREQELYLDEFRAVVDRAIAELTPPPAPPAPPQPAEPPPNAAP